MWTQIWRKLIAMSSQHPDFVEAMNVRTMRLPMLAHHTEWGFPKELGMRQRRYCYADSRLPKEYSSCAVV